MHTNTVRNTPTATSTPTPVNLTTDTNTGEFKVWGRGSIKVRSRIRYG